MMITETKHGGSSEEQKTKHQPDFTGESTTLLHPAVLGSNLDLGTQAGLDGGEEHERRADNNLCS
jgi:hypothetical protein